MEEVDGVRWEERRRRGVEYRVWEWDSLSQNRVGDVRFCMYADSLNSVNQCAIHLNASDSNPPQTLDPFLSLGP